MQAFKITDTGTNFIREAVVAAASRDEAQERYIDACESAGMVVGCLTVRRA